MQQEEALQSYRDVAETVYPGLDLSGEIRATKFGAVRDGRSAEHDYIRLLDACEALAVAAGISFMPEASYGRHSRWLSVI